MTTTHNSEGDHLSVVGPSRWVTRKFGSIQSHHKRSIDAVRWLRDHADSMNGWKVSKSYTVRVGYWDRSRGRDNAIAFEPEFVRECETFGEAMDALAGWLHLVWEQDRSNHPTPAGRSEAWERWHDVIALANIASLTMLHNPGFHYAFGPLSPREGRGHDLRISVIPTPIDVLDRYVEQNRGCDA